MGKKDMYSHRVHFTKINSLFGCFSIAVDFAKTGVCAPKLTKDLRPEEYPHYMEKEDKKTYQSITIVGLLYDQVKGYKIDLEMNMGEEILMASTFPWQSFHVDGFEEYKNDAIAIKHEYDRDLKRLMAQYGIKNEQEVISGYILKFNSKQHAKDSKISDLKNDIGQAYCKIRQRLVNDRDFLDHFFIFSPVNLDICKGFGKNSMK